MLCSNQSLYSPPCASQSVGAANQLFVALVETLSAALCAISPPQMWPKDYAPIAIRSGKHCNSDTSQSSTPQTI